MSNSMRFVTDLSKGVLGKPDSEEMWTEIISHIPVSDEELMRGDFKILVPACGHCTEAVILAKRMLKLGISKEQVNNSIWLIDKYPFFTNEAKKKYGFKNVILGDFLEWETDMKFDVVVGNPPYQDDSKGDAKRWPLWIKFLNKATTLTKESGYIGFISPASWLAPNNAFDIISARNVIYVNLGVSKYFDVGSTFSAYVVQNTINSKSNNKNTVFIDKLGNTLVVDWLGMKFLPTEVNNVTLDLVKKFYFSNNLRFSAKLNTENHTSQKNSMSSEENGNYAFKVFHTNSQTLWSKVKNSNYDTPKVIMTLSGHQKPIYDDCCGTSQVVMFFPVQDKIEGQNLVNVLNSNLYQFMMKICKYSGFALKKVIVNLPAVNLNRTWTNEELYKHFNLTQDEISYIEASVK